MKLYAMLALALLAGFWSGSGSAAPTRMLACNGCTAQQEENKVKNLGDDRVMYFTYNLTNARLRKFQTYLVPSDDKSAQGAAGGDGVVVARYAATADGKTGERLDDGGPKDNYPGWQRILEEYTPDAGVKRIFDLLLSVERERPGVTFGQSFVPVPIGNVGQTEGSLGVRDFDPRDIAWTRNLGNNSEYDKFMGRLQDKLSDAVSRGQVSSLLDKVLSIQFEIKSVGISVGSGGTVNGSVSIEPGVTSTLVKFCDPKFNCVVLKITNNKGTVEIQFVRVEDRSGTTLPAKDKPVAEWPVGGRDEATEYGNWLNGRGTLTQIIGGSTGCKYVLGCTAIVDTTKLACQVFCQ